MGFIPQAQREWLVSRRGEIKAAYGRYPVLLPSPYVRSTSACRSHAYDAGRWISAAICSHELSSVST